MMGEETMRLTTDLNLGFEGPRALGRRRLRAGEQVFFALSWGDASPPETFGEAHERLARTGDFWHEWISRGRFPDHPWRTYLQRSALTLKGLIYTPTGALMAAATTSLPETPGGERNYDYRYSWLRDSTFMLWGLYSLGFDREANDFFYFLTDLGEGDGDLQIMYGIGGERDLTEQTLDHLSGYEGARPVRIGNGAWDQRQHDVWGVLLDSVYLHSRSRDRLDERRWPMLVRQVEAALAHWRQPDQASGRCGGKPSISRRPKSCAGWRPTVEPSWRRSVATTNGRPAGVERPRICTTTSVAKVSTTAASSASTTTPPRSTRRCC
jgi:GH15 family glucan-1,4-alpha-glucosidase